MGLEPASVRPSTLSNMNISETSRPITTKFYLKHHWGALGFDADQIRTLVSMATDNSGERGGSVVECRTPEREVGGSIPTAAVLCP